MTFSRTFAAGTERQRFRGLAISRCTWHQYVGRWNGRSTHPCRDLASSHWMIRALRTRLPAHLLSTASSRRRSTGEVHPLQDLVHRLFLVSDTWFPVLMESSTDRLLINCIWVDIWYRLKHTSFIDWLFCLPSSPSVPLFRRPS